MSKPRLSVKAQTLAAILAVIGAVAVPQLFHAMGAVSGLGTSLGETFLPMHLPIILVGLIAGPYAGAISGLLGPLASHLMTGMPGSVMLPIMMIELCAYGALAGLLGNVKMPNISKVLLAQIGGRAVRAAAVLIAVYAFGNENIKVASIWNSVIIGVPGLVLQWSLLPLLMYRIENLKKNEQ
ncbi:MAG: ECF transporter S component [Ruminococcus sp.]|nr:ECF transporter S component [Ruminococcus sp.]